LFLIASHPVFAVNNTNNTNAKFCHANHAFDLLVTHDISSTTATFSSLVYWDVCLSYQMIILNQTQQVMRCYVMIVLTH